MSLGAWGDESWEPCDAVAITEMLLRQPPPVTRGLVMNMPASGTSVEHRLFQAAIHRGYAMTIKYDRGSQRGTGVGKRWLLEIGRYTYEDCIRRARVNLYLARRLNRTHNLQGV